MRFIFVLIALAFATIINEEKFISACKRGDLAAVQDCVDSPHGHLYLESGRGFNEAIQMHQYKVVRFLISDSRTKIDIWANEPIRAAATKGFAEIVSWLAADSRTSEAALNEALYLAATNDHPEVVEILLMKSAVVPHSDQVIQRSLGQGHHFVAALLYADARTPLLLNGLETDSWEWLEMIKKCKKGEQVDLNVDDNLLLWLIARCSASHGHLNMFKLVAERLLTIYPDTYSESLSFLKEYARNMGQFDIVDFIESLGS